MDRPAPRATAGYAIHWFFAALVVSAASSSAHAKDCRDQADAVAIGMAFSTRPYVFPRSNRGIQVDIVRQALERAGYNFCPVYLPPLRAARNFANGRLDGLMNVQTSRYHGHVSDPIITYQDCAYSLADNEVEIRTFEDFADWRVVAFQDATHILEKGFTDAIGLMSGYWEVANQEMQVLALFRERAEVAVMERRIFAFYWHQLAQEAVQSDSPRLSLDRLRAAIREDCLFQPMQYRIEFASPTVRDAFNAGLQQLQQTGRYHQIIRRYLPDMGVAQQ